MSTGTIPDKYVNLCREIGKLADEAGCYSMGVTFHPGLDSKWQHPIQMSWASGRHGANAKRVTVTSNINVTAEL